jgi:hypothetical protein
MIIIKKFCFTKIQNNFNMKNVLIFHAENAEIAEYFFGFSVI